MLNPAQIQKKYPTKQVFRSITIQSAFHVEANNQNLPQPNTRSIKVPYLKDKITKNDS
ncbi:hypothetical protein BSG1_10658 [Bacillus sp. SG-1]|nr:hypothetical protein BSG1_10658 [Bacillus sp. SG-1]